MRRCPFEPNESSKAMIFNGFHKGQTLDLSFMKPGFVR